MEQELRKANWYLVGTQARLVVQGQQARFLPEVTLVGSGGTWSEATPARGKMQLSSRSLVKRGQTPFWGETLV